MKTRRTRARPRRDVPSRAQTKALLEELLEALSKSDATKNKQVLKKILETALVAADALEERGYLTEADHIRSTVSLIQRNPGAKFWDNSLRASFRAGILALGNPAAPFLVSKTYETWTEEDAEAGDTDDRGYEFEDEPMTLVEVLRAIEELWPDKFSLREAGIRRRTDSITLNAGDAEVDYQTGTSTNFSLHIRGSARALRRLQDWLRHALGAGYEQQHLTERRKPASRAPARDIRRTPRWRPTPKILCGRWHTGKGPKAKRCTKPLHHGGRCGTKDCCKEEVACAVPRC